MSAHVFARVLADEFARALPSVALFALALAVGCTSAPEASPTVLAPAVSDAACVGGDRDKQRHGSACLCCHGDEFSVAGSVDVNRSTVAKIVVTDAVGDVREMAPNSFGNFFRHFALTPPLRVVAYGEDGTASPMSALAPHGDCNGCHAPGASVAPIHGP